jgi:enoyl-CoA hydratase/carnithine racemase
MSVERSIMVSIEEGVCWIRLNRPDKLNSMTLEMHELVRIALNDVKTDNSVGSIVIIGTGRAFSAGSDVSSLSKLSPEEAKTFSEKGQETIKEIMRHPKPVIAAVNGYALGGGCELALACDFRITSEKARFGLPEVSLGLIPGWGGTTLLAGLIGMAKAKEMILTGSMVNAEEAREIGLVMKIVEVDKLEEEAKNFAKFLASGAGLALKAGKTLLNAGVEIEDGLTAEAEAFSTLFSTEDYKEGVAAFLEKRRATFKGK